MNYVVAIFGGLITLLGIMALSSPTILDGFAKYFKKPGAIYLAALTRLVMGLVMINAAPHCRDTYYSQPIIFWFGVVLLISSVAILLIGSIRLARLVNWCMSWPPSLKRIWGLVAALLGAYLYFASGV